MSKSNFIPRPRVAKCATLRQLALKATRCSIEEFNQSFNQYVAEGRSYPSHITDGIDAFLYDIMFHDHMLDNVITPKQLSATIYQYGIHWFN
jgi:hypothetical protein